MSMLLLYEIFIDFGTEHAFQLFRDYQSLCTHSIITDSDQRKILVYSLQHGTCAYRKLYFIIGAEIAFYFLFIALTLH